MTVSIIDLPLLSCRTGIATSTFGVTFKSFGGSFDGSSGKFESNSILPPITWLSTVQSWIVEVPSIFMMLLRGTAMYVIVSAWSVTASTIAAAVLMRSLVAFILLNFK